MTKEQEKAIEGLNSLIKVNKDFFENQGNMIINKRDISAIEKVLNMLKEKDKEIEKKDKQIKELIKYIDSNNYVDNEECQFQWDFKIEQCIKKGDCKDCIKQYFERKVKHEN